MNKFYQRLTRFYKPQLAVLFLAGMSLVLWMIKPHYQVAQTSAKVPMALPSPALPPETGMHLSHKPLSFSVDCTYRPCLALTFDDGPDAVHTTMIVEAFESTGAKATFFMIGNRIDGNEELLRRMHASGLEIGNHSWSHGDFTRMSPEQIQGQIESTQNALRYARVPAARFFRAPYGKYDEAVQQNVGLPIVLWNIDPKDWQQTEASGLIHAVETAARPGGIVVLHDTESLTAAAMTELIHQLSQQYQLVTLSEMLSVPQDARGDTVIF